MSHKIGAGFNPLLLSDLTLHSQVELIEFGLRDFRSTRKLVENSGCALSLHLARTPITENEAAQIDYLDFIEGAVGPKAGLDSIGFHLTGSRFDGIGRYGFSSLYQPSSRAERSACRFIKLAHERFGCPIWIENANLYSPSSRAIVEAWNSFAQIIDASPAGVIADLSHLLIDAVNCKIDPTALVGLVPWPKVAEIHLSGIVAGSDQTLHDGHGNAVDDRVWNLLSLVVGSYLPADRQIFVTIEHTEPRWAEQKDLYRVDFDRLHGLLSSGPAAIAMNSAAARSERYAQSYLKKLVLRQIPRIESALEARGLNFETVFSKWHQTVLERSENRIVISAGEIPARESGHTVVAASSFLQFAKIMGAGS